MAHTRTWNAAYEAIPPNSADASEGAERIRDFKTDVEERLALDHVMDESNNDGKHKFSTYQVQGSDPSPAASEGVAYVKDVSSKGEFHYIDEDSNVVVLTSAGKNWLITQNNAWEQGQATAEYDLTDGATVSVDAAESNAFAVTLAGNRTLAVPTNGKDGQVITIRIIQDGSGSRTITMNSSYKKVANLDITLSTTAAKEDLMTLYFDGTVWVCLNLALDIKSAV